MKNSDKPIYPTLFRQIGENSFRVASEKDSREGMFLSSESGLTKREHFAGLFMQGLLATGYTKSSELEMNVDFSIRAADELLKQLEQ